MYEIVLKPIGGLGNRLYAMASGLELAKVSGRKLRVLWALKWELNARFTDFWEEQNWDLIYTDEFNFPQRFWDKLISKEKSLQRGKIVITNERMNEIQREMNSFDYTGYFSAPELGKNILIETCFNFYPKRNFRLADVFIPVQQLQQEINQFYDKNGREFIGMHIRRGDHDDSHRNSPDALFREIIEKTEPDKKIFLCTDDRETEQKLKLDYGNRIVTYSSDKSRDSHTGIHDAVMDILLLSGTEKIYGSYLSTFSSFAADYGNKELIVLKK